MLNLCHCTHLAQSCLTILSCVYKLHMSIAIAHLHCMWQLPRNCIRSACFKRHINPAIIIIYTGWLIELVTKVRDENILADVRGSDAVAREVRYHHSCYQGTYIQTLKN